MTRLSTMLLAGALTAIVAAPVQAESPRDEIEAAIVTFVTAFNAGDAAGAAAHYAEDAALFPPDALRVDGRAGIEAFWKQAMEDGFADLKLEALEVESSGDLAMEVGEAWFSVPDETGTRSTLSAKYIVVWKKGADGVWRLYRDIWNANPATPAQ